MSWHDTARGALAAKHGNDAVMTPDPPLYFDALQGSDDYEPLGIGGLTTLEMVYAFDPMPAGLTQDQARHILGVQGNLWTEYVPTSDHLFYMLLPRELALAEIAWTPRARRSWDGFSARAGGELLRLEAEGYRYRIPLVTFGIGADALGFPEQQMANKLSTAVTGDHATVSLSETAVDATIHYTLDGSLPTAASPAYAAPLRVPVTGGAPVTVTAIAVLAGGRASAPSFLNLVGETAKL
jgi:hexosaminidase